MPKLSGILSVFALFLFVIAAQSQGTVVISGQTGNGAASGSGANQGSNAQISVGVGGGMVGFFGSAPSGVKGLPFSADVVEETDQYLADGNHIHRESYGNIFRDSEGRTRTENEIGSGIAGSKPFVHILINDPVQNTFISSQSRDQSGYSAPSYAKASCCFRLKLCSNQCFTRSNSHCIGSSIPSPDTTFARQARPKHVETTFAGRPRDHGD